MTYNQLLLQIKETIDAASLGFQVVYTHHPEQYTSYPCLIITPIGHENQIFSLGRNKREYAVKILVVGNLEGEEADTQTTVRDLVDGVINTLEAQSNLTLDGVVDWSDATSAKYFFIDEPTRLYVGEITFRVIALFNRQS